MYVWVMVMNVNHSFVTMWMAMGLAQRCSLIMLVLMVFVVNVSMIVLNRLALTPVLRGSVAAQLRTHPLLQVVLTVSNNGSRLLRQSLLQPDLVNQRIKNVTAVLMNRPRISTSGRVGFANRRTLAGLCAFWTIGPRVLASSTPGWNWRTPTA